MTEAAFGKQSEPGAFVVLKASAFLGRGKNTDAYNLYYLVHNFGSGVEDVATTTTYTFVDTAPHLRELGISEIPFVSISKDRLGFENRVGLALVNGVLESSLRSKSLMI